MAKVREGENVKAVIARFLEWLAWTLEDLAAFIDAEAAEAEAVRQDNTGRQTLADLAYKKRALA